jgi:hypothetical protein
MSRTKERKTKEITKERKEKQSKAVLPSYSSSADAMKAGMAAWGGTAEEVEYCLATLPIGEEVPDLEPALPRPFFLPNLRPQPLLLFLRLGAVLEDMLPRLRLVPAPPALRGGPILRPAP